MLAESLNIDVEEALDLFYSTEIYKQLKDSSSGLNLMSDSYILENILEEIKK